MIDEAEIIKLVKEKLDDRMFLVGVQVSTNNVIRVYVDSYDGLTIDNCIEISRHIEHNLDREAEDFELQVSSPGLTESFKVREQFVKYTGREVEIVTLTGKELKGILKNTDANSLILESREREKTEGHKKKQLIVREYVFKFDEIKSAKAIISFK